MRAKLILLLVLCLVAPAFAAHESGPVGPYVVSFDMNTTMQYKVIVEAPSSGVTSLGVSFTRYNLTVESADYLAWLILTRYEEPMVANVTANEYIVYSALLNAGADQPNLYQPLIDGKQGVLGNFRFERQFLGQGQYQEGDLVVAAAYSPDAIDYGDGVYRGRTDCRIISTFPWEIIRDLLYTLHVEVPEEEGAPLNATVGDEEAKFLVNTTLSSAGIKDVSLFVADGRSNGGEKVLILGYSSQATDIDRVGAETAKILGAYLGAVSSGWDGESLMVSVGDIRGEYVLGTWYCTKEWTHDYISMDMTEEEILLNSLKTVSNL